ncbi:MAG: CvpA family protein [Verrucomicrobia bacterium]|nr:CvpA family protein [Verrucomicrobiota bacterium]
MVIGCEICYDVNVMNWIAAAFALPDSMNWCDFVVAGAVLAGLYVGLRMGLLRSGLQTATWLLMIVLALLLYPTLGMWMHELLDLEADSANLQAFLGVGLVVYLACHFAGREILYRASQRVLPAAADNFLGPVVGAVLMVVVMAWACFALALTRSQFWHEEVTRHSYFGARVVQPFPSVAAMSKKKQSDNLWFMDPIKRRAEPTPDSKGSR